jgi:hypothetical protein
MLEPRRRTCGLAAVRPAKRLRTFARGSGSFTTSRFAPGQRDSPALKPVNASAYDKRRSGAWDAATVVDWRRAKSDSTGRRVNMAATVRPALMPGTSIREYIARAAISDNTGAIKTTAAIPIFSWSQYVIANKIGK